MVREDQASSFVGPLRSGIILVSLWRPVIVLCQSVKISHHPLSSMVIQYHPMSVHEDQSSSFVSLHQGMRLPDKQTRYRQADKQTSKTTRKITKFLDLGAQKHRQRTLLLPPPASDCRRVIGDENCAAAVCCSCGCFGSRHFLLLFRFTQFFCSSSCSRSCLLLLSLRPLCLPSSSACSRAISWRRATYRNTRKNVVLW